MTQIFDNVLVDPAQYRTKALEKEFRSYDFGHCQFHGIAVDMFSTELFDWFHNKFPNLKASLSFFRKSPEGQEEPHFIHTDVDMGDWSSILYLNPNPPSGDGTNFWTHWHTGAIESPVPHERSEEGKGTDGWILREHVASKFNRLVMFPSSYFHSRAIHKNWGAGDEARLTQVTFFKENICL